MLILLLNYALATPSIGTGPACVTISVVGTDRPISVNWVGVGRLSLQSEDNVYSGDFCVDPSRFAQLQVEEAGLSLWEGTIYLTSQHKDTIAFRVVDLPPRTLLRVASLSTRPLIGGLPLDGVSWAWAVLVLLFLVGTALISLQRRRL